MSAWQPIEGDFSRWFLIFAFGIWMKQMLFPYIQLFKSIYTEFHIELKWVRKNQREIFVLCIDIVFWLCSCEVLYFFRFHIHMLMLAATIKWHLSDRQTNFHDYLWLSFCLIHCIDLNEISKYFPFLFSIKFPWNCFNVYTNVSGGWYVKESGTEYLYFDLNILYCERWINLEL